MIHAVNGDPLYTEIKPTDRTYKLDQVRLLAPVIPRSKLVALSPGPAEPGPQLLLKPNTSVAGPGDPIALPGGAAGAGTGTQVDHAGHRATSPGHAFAGNGVGAAVTVGVGAVISRITRDLAPDQVQDHVLGYTAVASISLDYPAEQDRYGFRRFAQDGFTPLGPWIDTDFAPGAATLLRVWVGNDLRLEDRADSSGIDMGTLVAAASRVATLLPGDVVVLNGTAAGTPIAVGDRLLFEVSGLGQFSCPGVAREAARRWPADGIVHRVSEGAPAHRLALSPCLFASASARLLPACRTLA
jgi:2-keto-4-pentenoate hydratase/2-oxohepta-3-ene-1,7-dioic acid hydratase in catechol pathway